MYFKRCKMKTKLILFVVLIVAVVNWVDGAAGLPTLPQPRYFVNDTVEWFPHAIGGSEVQLANTVGEVSIQNRYGYHLCSGTLISLNIVLTAASCLLNQDAELIDPSEIRVIADETNIIGEGSATRQIRDIENYYIHLTGGIAILELLNSFVVTSTLKYRQISNEAVTEHQLCYVIGWGVSPPSTNVRLQKIQVKILSNAVANSSKYYDGELPRDTISATYLSYTCFGDLGSALICDDAVVGILSFGYGCRRPDFPLIFYSTYDDLIIDNYRRGGSNNNGGSNSNPGSGSNGGSIGGTTLRPGGGSGGSNGGGIITTRNPGNGGSNGGSISSTTLLPGGGNNNNNIIIIPPGGNHNNNHRPNECNEEHEDECDGAAVIKFSLTVLLFPIIQYIFVKFINQF